VGLNSGNWTSWFETVVNQQVEGEETFRSGHGLEPTLIYGSDPPTLTEQLAMKKALWAKTPPGLWDGSQQLREVLESLWEDFSLQPVLRRKHRLYDPLHGEQPGTASQHSELYSSMQAVAADMPSIYCFPVAYPSLVVHEVPPVALVLTSPKQWTWERYRDALVTGVANLSARLR
jgi:hypothetical protein